MLDIIEAIFGVTGMFILSRKKANVFWAQTAFTIANISGVIYFGFIDFNPWLLLQFSIYLVLSSLGVYNNRSDFKSKTSVTENEQSREEKKDY
ncbi:MAG: hypothetical protein GF364_10035 [Candidatus Lokiarchaeota archaeon]|nr:hypothetical protein [Candidatus Lokiarchaeota archaeon]